MQDSPTALLLVVNICWRLLGKKRQLTLIGKSASASFRVRVVRGSERARRSCVGVQGERLLNAGGSAGKMSSSSGLGLGSVAVAGIC